MCGMNSKSATNATANQTMQSLCASHMQLSCPSFSLVMFFPALFRCSFLLREARPGFLCMLQPTGWDPDYPSTLQSLDWTLGTIPCEVTYNVK